MKGLEDEDVSEIIITKRSKKNKTQYCGRRNMKNESVNLIQNC